MKSPKFRLAVIAMIFCLSSVSTTNFAQSTFTLPKVYISGKSLKEIKEANYKYIILRFATNNGKNYFLKVYGQKGGGSSDLLDDKFEAKSEDTTFRYPCIFGNLQWKEKIPRGIGDNDRYCISPVGPTATDYHIYYDWARVSTTGPVFSSTRLNPVPPRSAASIASEVSALKVEKQ